MNNYSDMICLAMINVRQPLTFLILMNRAYYPTLMSLTIKLQHTAYYGNMGCCRLDEDYNLSPDVTL